MNDLDRILARSAPAASPGGTSLDAAIAALVDEARVASAPSKRWRRRAVVAGTAAAVAGLGGAAAYATATVRSDAWGELSDEASADAVRLEWLTTLPDGTLCVERLTGIGLEDAQVTAIASALADPDRLLAIDDGSVRDELLAVYDANEKQQAIADRAAWESWIDAGYAAVAAIDLADGRGQLADERLDVVPPGAENEVFLHSSMRVVIDGLTAQGIDAISLVTPETACEAGE